MIEKGYFEMCLCLWKVGEYYVMVLMFVYDVGFIGVWLMMGDWYVFLRMAWSFFCYIIVY